MNPLPKKPEADLTLKLDHATPPSRPAGIDGVELIYAERVRQITVNRRPPEDDVARNTNGQLAMAGACYALLAGGQSRTERMPGGTPRRKQHGTAPPVAIFRRRMETEQ